MFEANSIAELLEVP